jgi:hypothetical protein
MKKITSASPVEFLASGTVPLVITPEGIVVSDEVAAIIQTRIGSVVTITDVAGTGAALGLNATIVAAQAAFDAASPAEGTNQGDRIVGSHDTLKAAIAVATAVNVSTTATDEDEDGEAALLSVATDAFKAAVVGVVHSPSMPTSVLTANPMSLPHGGGDSVLSWTSTGAVSATIDNGVGVVSLDASGNGTVEAEVQETTSYTLTVTNTAGSTTSTATVAVA